MDDQAITLTDDAAETATADTDAVQEATDSTDEAVDTSPRGAAARGASPDLDRQSDVAADYLEGLLDILDLDGDIDLDVEAGRALVSVIEARTGELAHLVGEDGEVLAAVQDLTRLAVTQQTGERSRLILDIAGHRARRRDGLRKIGEAAVAEARETGAPVRLAAMSAFERKVIHDVVAEAGLVSQSEGADPQRYVVITP